MGRAERVAVEEVEKLTSRAIIGDLEKVSAYRFLAWSQDRIAYGIRSRS
jgi:hypothetical protein